MGAPQIICVVLAVIDLIFSAIFHGHSYKRSDTISFPITFVAKLLTFGFLYWGGFFGG